MKKKLLMSKIILTRCCKKDILLKAKKQKYYFTGCPKRGGKTKSLGFFLTGTSATKSQELSGMGCLKIFAVKWKTQRPSPCI